MKINKRILRCEYGEIAPEAYMPDFETQQRLNPGLIAYGIHQYVTGHVEREGFVFRISAGQSQVYQNFERLPCVADKGTFQADTSTAPSAEGHRFGSEDVDQVLAILDGCIADAEDTLNPNLSQKEVHRVWNSIKCAYGGKHAPPDEAVFESTF